MPDLSTRFIRTLLC